MKIIKNIKSIKILILSDEGNKAIVNSTGIDEALRYLDVESLKLMLQEG